MATTVPIANGLVFPDSDQESETIEPVVTPRHEQRSRSPAALRGVLPDESAANELSLTAEMSRIIEEASRDSVDQRHRDEVESAALRAEYANEVAQVRVQCVEEAEASVAFQVQALRNA